MKLATFRVETPVGPFDRFGVVLLDGGPSDTIENSRQGRGRIVDVNFAHAAMEADGGSLNPTGRADAFCPSDLQRYGELHGTDWSLVKGAVAWAEAHSDAEGPRGETLVWALNDIALQPPIARVPVLRGVRRSS
jgi:hypothetical protein